MKIKMMSPDDITPYENNPRLISEDAIEAVSKSIKSAGFRQPVVVDSDNVIIIGHTRWHAANSMGLEKIPVHVAEDLNEDQTKALRLNDNRVGEVARWDQVLLGIEVSDLAASGFDLEALAFDDDELSRLLDAGDTQFEPEINPVIGGMGVSDDDIGVAVGEQQSMGERSKQILTSVICPDCGHEFYLNPEDMNE